MSSMYTVLYHDDAIVLIDKAPGILVHKNPHQRSGAFLVHNLSGEFHQQILGVHRLDRATSGVMVFAKTSEAAAGIASQIREGSMEKSYLALVRGKIEEEVTVEKPLPRRGLYEDVPAKTIVTPKAFYELNHAVGRYDVTWLSLVELKLLTGRTHQARLHLRHLRNPILGDKKYGDSHYNKFFTKEFALSELMLRAYTLSFKHPITKEPLKVVAGLSDSWKGFFQNVGLQIPEDVQQESALYGL